MKLIIISPPNISPFVPPLGILALKSFLSGKGIKTFSIDASIESFHYLLSPSIVKKNYLLSQKSWKNKFTLNEKRQILKKRLNGEIDFSMLKFKEIDEFLKKIWNNEGFNISKNDFKFQISYLSEILLYTYSHYYPTILTFFNCNVKISQINDNKKNPFIGYYHDILLPEIKSINPDLIGISISYIQQLIPALSLINEIKESNTIPIVTGGSWFSMVCDELSNGEDKLINFNNVYFSKIPLLKTINKLLAPYGIQGEGESPLLELCDKLKKGTPVLDIHGLVYKDDKTKAVKFNKLGTVIPTNDLPVIDLDNFKIKNKYLTPIPIAPLMSSRGCYWNKCSFCNQHSIIGNRFRELPVETIIRTLEHFHKKGIKYALFCDEAMSPLMLKNISDELLNANFNIYFGTMTRIEKAFIDIIDLAKNAGFKSISFGLESSNRRIIKMMNKGFSLETALELLDRCFSLGIFVQFHIIFGFPTETDDEAMETISFLENNHKKITCVRPHAWFLAKKSPISKNPDKYGIISSDKKDNGNKNNSYKNNAYKYIDYLKENPFLKNKVIFDIINEEYFVIENLLQETLN